MLASFNLTVYIVGVRACLPIITLVLLHGFFCRIGHADVIQLGPAKDNTLYEFVLPFSNGAGEYFFSGHLLNNDELRRGLLAFDMDGSIAAGSTINSVSLTLRMSNVPPGADADDFSLHRVLSDWGESTSDAPGPEGGGINAEPGDATWTHTFFSTQFWGNAGGDFVAQASDTQNLGTVPNAFYTWSSTGMVTDVQFWLDNPGQDFGWIIIGEENDPGSARRFATRENGVPSFRPILEVDYTPLVVPEPRVIAYIVLALLCFRYRILRCRSTR